jgi:hypothetical protein
MQRPDGIPKGIRTILTERGPWDPNLRFKDAHMILSQQPDFQEQKEWLQEVVTNSGFVINYYPKYHCEFNFIEMFGGTAKAFSKSHCTFNFNNLV